MKKILTVVIDGFGLRDKTEGNAVKEANPINFINMYNKYPHTSLYASGEYIGLTNDQVSDSKVSYEAIGSGRKLNQNKLVIDKFLNNEIKENEEFLNMISYLKETEKTLHIIGLLSDGEIHSDYRHFIKLYDILDEFGVKNINFNIITDGKNTKSCEAYKYIKELEDRTKKNKDVHIGSICGRMYAMDRDNNYKKTKYFYDLICNKKGIKGNNIKNVIKACYDKKLTDESIPPIMFENYKKIENGDVVIWMNYREDSSRQILESLTNRNFKEFSINSYDLLKVYTFFNQGNKINVIPFLEDSNINNSLGIYLSKLGITQARIAESLKFQTISTYFDGNYTGQIEGCTRYVIPSLELKRDDEKPELSAAEITRKAISCMERDVDFVLVNYANPDIIAHTGNYKATVEAVKVVDLCLGKLLEEAENNFYKVIVLSSYGNAEEMLDEKGEINKNHTLSKVPFIICDSSVELLKNGDLTNVAPTILDYMDIALPSEMKGTQSLIERD